MKPLRLSLAAVSSLASLAAAAEAHAVDYDAFESLFNEPVTTSVTGAPQRASEVPATMEILTTEDIRRSGARNIPDLLANATGLDVRRVSQGGVDVAIRGYNQALSPRILVLVNGRQVYLDHYGFTNWDLVPFEMSEIRQIEIVKGPGTALFGFNAVSGVINIVTYSPLDKPIGATVARVGTQSFRELSGAKIFRLAENAGLRLSAGYHEADEFGDAEASRASGVYEPRRLSFAGEFLAQVSAKTQLGFEGTYVEARRVTLNPFYFGEAADGETWSARAYGVSETPLGLVTATAYYNHFENTINLTAPPGNFFGNRVAVAQIEDVFKAGAQHTFRLAAEYRANELFGTGAGEVKLGVSAASAMWSWVITPRLTSTVAARYDSMQVSDARQSAVSIAFGGLRAGGAASRQAAATSYNAGLVFRATDADTFRVSAGRGIQAPSLVEFASNPTLDPTVLTSLEVAYDRRVEAINGGFSADIFTQKLSSVQVFRLPLSSNFGDSESWGAELELKGVALKAWNWKLGYIYQNVYDDLNNRGIGPLYTQPAAFEKTTSNGIFVGQVGRKAGRFTFDLFLRGVSATEQFETRLSRGFELNRVPAYLSTGARIALQLNDRLEIELTGQDLTNGNKEQFATFRVEPRGYLALRGTF